MTPKVIKQITTNKYEIALVEIDGMYCVFYGHPEDDTEQYQSSEPVTDYNTASYFFDLKLQDLEGH